MVENARTLACPVCHAHDVREFAQARDLEYFTSDEVYQYWECPACTAVFLQDTPIHRLHEVYPSTYYSYQPGGRVGLLERVKRWLDVRLFRRLLARLPGDKLNVLDVGGGSGWLLSLVRSASPRVAETHEVDIDESARAAAEAAGHHFHATPIEQFQSDQAFDLVLLLNLIEHVADPASVLRAVHDRLKPGGLAVIKTPNTDTWDRRLFQHRNWAGFHCPRHWVLFTLPGLKRLAEQCGFEVAQARYTQGGPQWAVSWMAWLWRRGLIEMSAERPASKHPLFAPLMALGAAIDFARLPFCRTAQMVFVLQRPLASQESSHQVATAGCEATPHD